MHPCNYLAITDPFFTKSARESGDVPNPTGAKSRLNVSLAQDNDWPVPKIDA